MSEKEEKKYESSVVVVKELDSRVGASEVTMDNFSSVKMESPKRNHLLLSLRSSGSSFSNNSNAPVVVENREPSESFEMTYSERNSQNQLKLEIDPRLVSRLQAPQKQVQRRPSRRRSTARASECLPLLDVVSSIKAPKPKKKVRFADNVTIHRISIHKGATAPSPETVRFIISLRGVWKQLDLDKDKYLNMTELRRFADELWEDEDVEELMKNYAAHPDKGMSFGEWCALLKEEDPDLTDLIEDLYEIFVEESETEDDEKDFKDADSMVI